MTYRMIFVRTRAPRRSAPPLTSRNSNPSNVVSSRSEGLDRRAPFRRAPTSGGELVGSTESSGADEEGTLIDEARAALSPPSGCR